MRLLRSLKGMYGCQGALPCYTKTALLVAYPLHIRCQDFSVGSLHSRHFVRGRAAQMLAESYCSLGVEGVLHFPVGQLHI